MEWWTRMTNLMPNWKVRSRWQQVLYKNIETLAMSVVSSYALSSRCDTIFLRCRSADSITGSVIYGSLMLVSSTDSCSELARWPWVLCGSVVFGLVDPSDSADGIFGWSAIVLTSVGCSSTGAESETVPEVFLSSVCRMPRISIASRRVVCPWG